MPIIQSCSKQFKHCVKNADLSGMEKASKAAWEAMTNLFDVLRNEQDHGHLSASCMNASTGHIVKPLSLQEQNAMIAAGRINKEHLGFGALTLREALNKIAHYDTNLATFRVDGRGAHYLVLGGKQGSAGWIVEILVSRLCKNAATAVKHIA